MEPLRSAVLTACMMSAAVGMLSMICAGKALARQMRFLLSLLFAVSLAVPLLHLELPADPDAFLQSLTASQEDTLAKASEEMLLTQTRTRLQGVLRDALEGDGMTVDELETDLHMDADGRICISKVTVCCDDFAGANARLSALLGEEVEICVTQILTENGSP